MKKTIWSVVLAVVVVLGVYGCVNCMSTGTSTYNPSTPAYSKPSSSKTYPSSSSVKSYSGNDTGTEWRKMSSSEKTAVVQDIMASLKGKGYSFSVGASWFVEAIDAYYGDGGLDGTKIIEAFSTAGVFGGVMEVP